MNLVTLIRIPRDPITLQRGGRLPVKLMANRGPLIFVQPGGEVPALPLAVTQNGQTVWDLGRSEVRRTLWVGGLRYFEGTDYTLADGILTWQGGFTLRLYHPVF
ncbi:MAG: hypothetical protein EOO39_16295 [Cytophagaceae bacterium]|nr:MAG: hypothetical protein EOO39_16295 [Cytophagaceae bacterium]